MNDSEILKAALALLERRNEAVDRALKDANLLSAKNMQALEQIDEGIAKLREVQINARKIEGAKK